ncbi:quinone oxidoreductase [Candidatus Aquiluna sp. UB-MaderosW2red]|uniref:quinone oxidoreductase family protein n=1 Tax=Candidatus Aquiluna sp. UB-MaderosW2red TaxID=1855377 RepID=UPI000875C13D|nr:quinone oxidoreductase [Candidatus Aquiluna sp. UB-MaderosW2red]SCX15201.1 NADPH2:quinone reductase [Candidatus Aquiluna sp. UB-MaderosW2red]
MRAVQIESHDGPEALILVEVPTPIINSTEVLVRNDFAGVNYIDVYQRSGMYPMSLPATLGLEGAGEIVALGDSVTDLKIGDRVAWGWAKNSYAEYVAISQDSAVIIPAGISTQVAGASMMQCTTAHYLATSVFQAKSGDTALVHAASGGVGLILCQMLSAKGVRVIGAVSNPEKEQLAKEAGASEIIRYDQVDFAAGVYDITKGEKCEVVYDGVGASTFEGSLQCLKPRGTLALFGAASGPVPPFDLQRLGGLGSLVITRPTIAHFISSKEELLWRTSEIFEDITSRKLKIQIGGIYDLEDAHQAHKDLESRATGGKLLLRI